MPYTSLTKFCTSSGVLSTQRHFLTKILRYLYWSQLGCPSVKYSCSLNIPSRKGLVFAPWILRLSKEKYRHRLIAEIGACVRLMYATLLCVETEVRRSRRKLSSTVSVASI